MDLEEKIESLPDDLRAEVEQYVDFLISRKSPFTEERTDNSIKESDIPLPNQVKNMRKVDQNGIILAAEDYNLAKDPDAIDFADINSRFGKESKDNEKPPKLSNCNVDWL